MPTLGFRTFEINPRECAEGVSDALAAGYRHLDKAAPYLPLPHQASLSYRSAPLSGW